MHIHSATLQLALVGILTEDERLLRDRKGLQVTTIGRCLLKMSNSRLTRWVCVPCGRYHVWDFMNWCCSA